MKKIFSLVFALLFSAIGFAQNPQTQKAPISALNAQYVNGIGPGYWVTAGSGLTLNVSSGTSWCDALLTNYAGGTLTMTASTTNYIYLNSSNDCTPATKTTAFIGGDIPIATVVTSSSAITTITDERTMFSVTIGSISGSGTLGYLPIWTGNATIGNSQIDFGITTANTLTSQGSLQVNAIPSTNNTAPFITLQSTNNSSSAAGNITLNASTTTDANSSGNISLNTNATGGTQTGNISLSTITPGDSTLNNSGNISLTANGSGASSSASESNNISISAQSASASSGDFTLQTNTSGATSGNVSVATTSTADNSGNLEINLSGSGNSADNLGIILSNSNGNSTSGIFSVQASEILFTTGNILLPSIAPTSGTSCVSISSAGLLGNISCSSGGGSGISGSGTTGYIPEWNSSNSLTNSLLDDGVTTTSTLTYTGAGGFSTYALNLYGNNSGVNYGPLTFIAPSTTAAYSLTFPANPPTGTSNYLTCSSAQSSSCTWGSAATVTSIGFAGDGTVLSSAISGPITDSGTLTATLANAPAYTLLGNATNTAAPPTYTYTVGTAATNILQLDSNGTVPIANGGTGATTAATALTNIGAAGVNGTITSGYIPVFSGTNTITNSQADFGITTANTLTSQGSLQINAIPDTNNTAPFISLKSTSNNASTSAGNFTLATTSSGGASSSANQTYTLASSSGDYNTDYTINSTSNAGANSGNFAFSSSGTGNTSNNASFTLTNSSGTSSGIFSVQANDEIFTGPLYLGSGNSVGTCTSIQEDNIGTCVVSIEEQNTSATANSGLRVAQYWSPVGAIGSTMTGGAIESSYDYDNVTSGDSSAIGLLASAHWEGDTYGSDRGIWGIYSYAEVDGNAPQYNAFGISGELDVSSNSTTPAYALDGIVGATNLYGTEDALQIFGVYGNATTNPGSGIATQYFAGLDGEINVNHTTGTIPLAASVLGQFFPITGDITKSAIFYAQSPDTVDGTSGTSTLHAGLYLEEQSGNGAGYTITNPYQIYSIGTSPSYFAGNVEIGTTGSAYKFEVNGTAKIDGTITIGGHIIPSSDQSWNIGSATLGFTNAYIGIINSPTSADSLILNSASTIGPGLLQYHGTSVIGWIGTALYPFTNGGMNLGIATAAWNNVYAADYISTGTPSLTISGTNWSVSDLIGGTTTGQFTLTYSGTTASTGTLTITLPTSNNGWTCQDTAAGGTTLLEINQTASTTTSATLTYDYTAVSSFVATHYYMCMGY
ncbi:Uncharacterised protein [uncultured archaeon]|nr:Uncharacterised protein [uncultured archaeon]